MRTLASALIGLALLVPSTAAAAQTSTNQDPISIPALGAATPYPSEIEVEDVHGTLTEVQVYLMGITHLEPDQIDVLLVGPVGQSTILMSDACGSEDFSSKIFFFADVSPFALEPGLCVTAHGYKPSDTEPGVDVFDPPAPAGPYPARMSVFNGTRANGVWSLFVVDDEAGDAGVIEAGWLLQLTIRPDRCAGRRTTLSGTAGADVLRGTPRRDVISGLGGDDVIRGLRGGDFLCGGLGRDRLIGNKGNDTLVGGKGRDRLIGGWGRDSERQ